MNNLRAVPVQSRSLARLESLRLAARQVIAEKGRDRFTTADIAERSGASIGTVYRYFPDRVAVLDDLYPGREMILRDQEGPSADAMEQALKEIIDLFAQTDRAVPARDKVRRARALAILAVNPDQ